MWMIKVCVDAAFDIEMASSSAPGNKIDVTYILPIITANVL
jgi:hypothetical protein